MLKQQFSRITDTSIIEMPESSSTLTTARKRSETFGLSDSKSMYFYHKIKRYLEGFPRYLEDFLRISGKILSDRICSEKLI